MHCCLVLPPSLHNLACSQGLLTQDVRHLTSKPLYSCILNAQGRFLHDMFLHPADQCVHADVHRAGLPDIIRLLKRCVDALHAMAHHTVVMYCRYRLHSKVDIEDVSDVMAVCVAYGGNTVAASKWLQDPRLAVLGQRAVVDSTQAPDGSADGFRLWRVQHGVAEGDEEIPTGMCTFFPYTPRILIDVHVLHFGQVMQSASSTT